ncbi:uncharacterized protein BYT42DRAFT_609281 [Radiomyces spectabilis]|uniref:uncharacterized protein n=1 Tax=Radiomyces spectabilis TaxID=64574 RepID=UPI002220CBD9|nr:uncharacterized protein BYT42DRAFT_609281 [Radiomyces spectabilis]KAI8393490.1 hypothetical protein BYT42DRAFT_609281 [Radiomyces spectabilis]
MVSPSQSRSRRPSSVSSGTARSDRPSKSRPSIPRATAAAPSTTSSRLTTATAYAQQQQQRRAQSFSTVASTTDLDLRRPSAPAPRINKCPSPTPRLSIADKFMSANYSQTRSVSPAPSITAISITSTSYSDNPAGRLSVADRFMPTPSSDHGSVGGRDRSSSSFSGRTLSVNAASAADPERLTIARAFMQSPSPQSTPNRDRSRSLVDAGENIHPTQPEPVHPLDAPSIFDTNLLPLDLSLPTPTGSVRGEHYNARPWGSQETLVQIEKKKSSTESEKYYEEKYMGARPYSFGDYYGAPQDPALSDACSAVQKIDYADDRDNESIGDHDQDHERDNHRKHSRWQNMAAEEEGDEIPQRGMWVGCCFISCGPQQPQPARKINNKKSAKKSRRCGRRSWVFGTFISMLLLLAVSYVLWPRTPLMRVEGASLTTAPKVSKTRQGVMVGNVAFESEWLVNVTVDNRQNHVPTRLVKVQSLVKDALTGVVIGKGVGNDDANAEVILLPPHAISTIQLPIVLDYQARDETDTTFSSLVKACTPQPTDPADHNNINNSTTAHPHLQRESLQLHFWITLHIFGLEWFGYKPTVVATPATGGFACPLFT